MKTTFKKHSAGHWLVIGFDRKSGQRIVGFVHRVAVPGTSRQGYVARRVGASEESAAAFTRRAAWSRAPDA